LAGTKAAVFGKGGGGYGGRGCSGYGGGCGGGHHSGGGGGHGGGRTCPGGLSSDRLGDERFPSLVYQQNAIGLTPNVNRLSTDVLRLTFKCFPGSRGINRLRYLCKLEGQNRRPAGAPKCLCLDCDLLFLRNSETAKEGAVPV